MPEVGQWNVNHSYLWGYDLEFGWGNRSYFTFYSQFGGGDRTLGLVFESLALAVIFLVGATGNVAILAVLCRSQRVKTTTNCFIGNLAVAGLVLTLHSVFILVTRVTRTWVLGQTVCSLVNYSGYAGAVTSVWTMTFISIDRYRATLYRTPLQLSTGLWMLCALWTVVLLASVPMAIFFISMDFSLGAGHVTICTLVWPNSDVIRASLFFTVSSVLFMFLLPFCILIHNYFRILCVLFQMRRNLWQHTSGTHRSPATIRRYRAQKSRNRKDLKVVRILILMVLLFAVMWLPLSVCFVVILYDGITDDMIMTSQAFLAGSCFTLANACINPFLYRLVNEKYAFGCVALCWHWRMRCSNRERRVRISPIPVVHTWQSPLVARKLGADG